MILKIKEWSDLVQIFWITNLLKELHTKEKLKSSFSDAKKNAAFAKNLIIKWERDTAKNAIQILIWKQKTESASYAQTVELTEHLEKDATMETLKKTTAALETA